MLFAFFFFNDTATTEIYTLSLHDALPISLSTALIGRAPTKCARSDLRITLHSTIWLLPRQFRPGRSSRSEEHTSELQSRLHLVCRLLLEKKKYSSQILVKNTSHRIPQHLQ